MAKGPGGEASTLELATAYGILKGKSVSQAMRDAGYAESSARCKAGKVEARLRDLGLLPTPEGARDIIAMLKRVVVDEDKGAGLETVFRVALSQARAGDDKARRFLMEFLVGKPSQPVAVTGADGGPVETVTRVIIDLSGDALPRDDDGE